jgi:arginase family enzyme
MSVHSKQLGTGNGVGTAGSTIYTVPSGKRTIVKSIVLQNNNGSANRVIIGVFFSGGSNVSWGVTLGASASATESLNYATWFVMNVGDSLKITPASDFVNVIASGSELDL